MKIAKEALLFDYGLKPVEFLSISPKREVDRGAKRLCHRSKKMAEKFQNKLHRKK